MVLPPLGEAHGRMTRGGSPGGVEDRKFKCRGPKSKSLVENPWLRWESLVQKTGGEPDECRWFDSIYEHSANPEPVPAPPSYRTPE